MKTTITLDFSAPNPEQGNTNIVPGINKAESLLEELIVQYETACDVWAKANEWYDELEEPTEIEENTYWDIVNRAHRIEEQISSLRKVLSHLNSLEYAMYELGLTME